MPTPADAPALPRSTIDRFISKTPFAALLDVQVLAYDAGRVEIAVPIVDRLKQHHGFVHGAVIGFVADSACAWAAASCCGDVVTVEYKLNFLRPAVGDRLIGHGKVVHMSAKQAVCQAEIFAAGADGPILVAVAQATTATIAGVVQRSAPRSGEPLRKDRP